MRHDSHFNELDDQPLPLPPLMARAPDSRSATPLPWGTRVREALGNYIPVLLMAALAAASWWLVKSTPVAPGPAAERAPRHEPDYEMRGFSVQHYTAAGPAQGVLEGDVVRHFPDTDAIEVDGLRLRWRDSDSRLLHGSSDHGTAIRESGLVTLRGNVLVRRDGLGADEAALELRGERMQFDTQAGRVSSQEPVTIRQGRSQLRAGRMVYDHEAGITELAAGVQGELAPTTRQR